MKQQMKSILYNKVGLTLSSYVHVSMEGGLLPTDVTFFNIFREAFMVCFRGLFCQHLKLAHLLLGFGPSSFEIYFLPSGSLSPPSLCVF